MNRILKLIVIFCLTFGFLNGISLANSLSDVDGVDFNPYMNTMYSSIKKNWHPTENSGAGKVVVSYKIKRENLYCIYKIDKFKIYFSIKWYIIKYENEQMKGRNQHGK